MTTKKHKPALKSINVEKVRDLGGKKEKKKATGRKQAGWQPLPDSACRMSESQDLGRRGNGVYKGGFGHWGSLGSNKAVKGKKRTATLQTDDGLEDAQRSRILNRARKNPCAGKG